MLDQLKKMAMQRLAEKMLSNVLSDSDTQAAAEDGANGLMETLTGAISGGGLEQVTDLLTSGGNMQDNGLFQNLTGTLMNSLQQRGMDQAAAQSEAANVVPDLINGLREKFESPAQEDAAFDLGALANLAGGDLGDMAQKAGGILNVAKSILGK